jgi:diadenosine tetraphosphatase ApaH/serine/threonine PP2A family protein phosphatase
MRVLVISDIHANLPALQAVIEDAGSYEAVWCLGDLVGYGPEPNECIELVRSLPDLTCLIGNHDQAALDKIPLSRFNRDAGAVVAWTQSVLTAEHTAYLESLESKVVRDNFTLVHGSPIKPIWEYILDTHTADRSFEAYETDFCIVGHSHLPLIFHQSLEGIFTSNVPIEWDQPMALVPRMILNPGSVGQPRDRDPRACYAVLDTVECSWEMRRTGYDISQVQRRILEAGLPERQALRLLAGW